MTDNASSPGNRMHALDAVRAGALLLGITFHAAMSFIALPENWVVSDARSDFLTTYFFVVHIFRMAIFFLIAGFFARMLLERRGARGFVRNRVIRIALPLVVFWPIILAAVVATFLWGAAAMHGGKVPVDRPMLPTATLSTLPLMHFWFLYMLLWLYGSALVLRGLFGLIDRDGVLRTWLIDPVMDALIATPLSAAVFATPLAVALAAQPQWVAWGGIPTPDKGFLPNATAFIAFGTAFGLGWHLHRKQSALHALARRWPAHCAAAIGMTLACLWQLGGSSILAPIDDGIAKTTYAVTYALAVWAWTLGLTGAALRFMRSEHPVIRYVADASYWIYLTHLPIVMALQVMVFGLALPSVVKWAVITLITFFILTFSYHLCVRRSWVGKWLNGREYSRTQ